jgi:hypothetical protein
MKFEEFVNLDKIKNSSPQLFNYCVLKFLISLVDIQEKFVSQDTVYALLEDIGKDIGRLQLIGQYIMMNEFEEFYEFYLKNENASSSEISALYTLCKLSQ